jgi:hypothetical protein
MKICAGDAKMDIGVLRGQLERKIAAADEEIRGREAQIGGALKQENEAAIARIKDAREALAMLDQVSEKIEALGPLEADAASGDAQGKRVPQKKIVDPIIEDAELSGIAFEEIIAHARRSHGVELKSASLKSFLSRMKAEGIYEQSEDGRWRLSTSASSRAAAE